MAETPGSQTPGVPATPDPSMTHSVSHPGLPKNLPRLNIRHQSHSAVFWRQTQEVAHQRACQPPSTCTTRDIDHSTVVNNNGHVNNLVQRAATADPAQFSALVTPSTSARQQLCPRTGQNQIPATAETPQFSVPPRHALWNLRLTVNRRLLELCASCSQGRPRPESGGTPRREPKRRSTIRTPQLCSPVSQSSRQC